MSATGVIDSLAKLISVKTKSRVLFIERVLTYVFSGMLAVEILLLVTLVLATAECRDISQTLDQAVDTTTHSPGGANLYLGLVCATQIKTRAFLMFWLRILMLLSSTLMLFCNAHYVKRIDEDLTDDHIIQNGNLARRWVCYKIVSFVFVVPVFVVTLVLSYTIPAFWQLLVPVPAQCSRHMIFEENRTSNYVCHFDQEFLIFCLWCLAQLIGIALGILWLISLGVSIYLNCYRSDKCCIRKQNIVDVITNENQENTKVKLQEIIQVNYPE